MLFAKNKQNEWVFAQNATKKDNYFCPDCEKTLILKQGQKMSHHFAHEKQCEQQRFSEGETKEHVMGKMLLFQAFKQLNVAVYLEPYLKQVKQCPDLLVVTKNQKIAIEFQCSIISDDIVKQRTKGYEENGIDVIWIVGKKHINSTKLTYYQLRPALSLLFLDIATKKVYLKCEDGVIHIPFSQLLQSICYNNKKRVSQCQSDQTILSPRQFQKRFLLQLYQQKRTLSDIPKSILSQKQKEFGTVFYQYELLTWLYVMCDELYTNQFMTAFIQQFKFVDTPFITAYDLANYIFENKMKQLKELS